MFVGSVPKDARIIISEVFKDIPKNSDVYVGCSGNFTIDRILSQLGLKVHSNDVALYSKCIADLVMKKPTKFKITESKYQEVFDSKKAGPLYEELLREKKTLIYSDILFPECESYLKGLIRIGVGRRDIYLYHSISEKKFCFQPPTKVVEKFLNIIPQDYVFNESTKLSISQIDGKILNHYRHLFMSLKVDYKTNTGTLNLAFMADGQVFGFASFEKFMMSTMETIYMMTDFVVNSNEGRLSKLLLMVLKSKEVKKIVCRTFFHDYHSLKTSVFTDKPVSMKYRGIFQLLKRDKGKLMYQADFTTDSINEILLQWMKKHKK